MDVDAAQTGKATFANALTECRCSYKELQGHFKKGIQSLILPPLK